MPEYSVPLVTANAFTISQLLTFSKHLLPLKENLFSLKQQLLLLYHRTIAQQCSFECSYLRFRNSYRILIRVTEKDRAKMVNSQKMYKKVLKSNLSSFCNLPLIFRCTLYRVVNSSYRYRYLTVIWLTASFTCISAPGCKTEAPINNTIYPCITYKKDASGSTGYTQTELEPRMLSYPSVFIWTV